MKPTVKCVAIGFLLIGFALIVWQVAFTNPLPEYEGRSVAEWFDRLNEPSQKNHTAIVANLESFRSLGPEAVPYLRKQLNKGDSKLRDGYVWLKSSLPAGVSSMLPEPSMDHTTARKLAAAALRWIGPEARDAVPDLIVALNDDDESVQNNALAALSSIGGESELLVPLFIPFLEHPQFMTRQNACSALGKFGTNASAAIPTLRAVATNDAYESVRERAAGALRMIDPKYSSE